MIDTPKVLIKGFKTDWSSENAFVFDLYSPKATGKRIDLALYSENPDTDNHDYYKYNFRVTWKGWKSFVIPFYSFKKVRGPIGFSKIDYIKIAADWGHEDADSVTELYFDNIKVTRALEIPGIFGDNMVLQEDKPIKIWGKAEKGEKIRVKLYSNKTKLEKKTVADKNGKWVIVFKPLKAGGPYTLEIKGNTKVSYNNIYVGDVWLCGGQSNMYFQLYKSTGGAEEIKKANYPNLRLFSVKRAISLKPVDTVSGSWNECSPATVKNFSAVAYYFGKYLLKNSSKKHIGLVMDCWGGTSAEAWMSRDAVVKNKKLSKIKTMMNDGFQNFDSIMKKYKEWDKIRLEYKKRGITDKSALPMKQPRKPHKIPTVLYNAMINPIINFNIKGVIWYQGESNANSKTVDLYYDLFSGLIKDWRSKWGYNFPFYFVQLPNYMERKNAPVEKSSKWAKIRDAQLNTLKNVKNTGLAVTIDLGEADNIHPHNKKPVGKRLSLWALAKTYNKKIVYSGPIYKNYKIKGNKIIIYFEPYSIGKGLVVKDGKKLKGFAIAGSNKKFQKATAVIKGNTVIVFNPEVKNPIAVRYAWASNPECNLYNKNGLPASPFRTDKWDKNGQRKKSISVIKEDWGE